MNAPHPARTRDDPQSEAEAGDREPASRDRLLIQRVLAQTPEERLRGLANAASFFAAARRV